MRSSSSQPFWLVPSSSFLQSSCGFLSEDKEPNNSLLVSEVKLKVAMGRGLGKMEIAESKTQVSVSPSLEGEVLAMREEVWGPSCGVEGR